jgi:soluble lytic murein transglycosylase
LTIRVSTSLLAGLVAAGVSAVVLHADFAGSAPLEQASTTATKASKAKEATAKDGKDSKAKDAKAKDTKAQDAKTKDAKTKDAKTKDAKTKDAKAKDAKTRDAKAKPADQKKHAAGAASSVPVPAARPGTSGAKGAVTTGAATSGAAVAAAPAAAVRPLVHPLPRFAIASTEETSSADIAAIKEAVSAARKGRTSQAADLQNTIGDPIGRKLVEWAILRSDETDSIEFSRYMTFISENPSWPAIGMLRRRAEGTLWTDRPDPSFVRSFFGKDRPTSAKGKFALARALLLQGDRGGARACPSS